MVRITKILCPVDFSESSRNAFGRAVAIARMHHAAVTVLHVVPVQPAVPLLPYTSARSVHLASPAVDRQQVMHELERFVAGRGDGVQVMGEVGEAPDVAWEICARALRLPADLIVMGTHGRSGFERLFSGSIAEKVLRSTRHPVLTVPIGVPAAIPIGAASFRRILSATDFSDCSLAALGYALLLAAHPDARLTVLHVVEITPFPYNPAMSPPIDVGGLQAMLENAGREELHRTISDTMRQTCRIEEVVTTGRPHREILRIAEEQQIDLIVLGVHGRGAFDRLIFGSTTAPVVRHAGCPVLTVRPMPGNADAETSETSLDRATPRKPGESDDVRAVRSEFRQRLQ